MNKLQELKTEWLKENFTYLEACGVPTASIETMANEVVETCAEYAKHELDEAPEDMEDCCDNETRREFEDEYSSKMNAYFCGMNSAIREKLASIEKDIKTLKQ